MLMSISGSLGKSCVFIACLISVFCSAVKTVKTEPEEIINKNEKIASVFEEEASLDASNYFFKKALKEYLSEGRWERAIQSYIRLGNGYVKKKEFNTALNYLNKGLNLAIKHSGYEYSQLDKELSQDCYLVI